MGLHPHRGSSKPASFTSLKLLNLPKLWLPRLQSGGDNGDKGQTGEKRKKMMRMMTVMKEKKTILTDCRGD